MTFIAALTGKESIWVLADRRISYAGGRSTDDARKILILETVDAKAILGYAGLGATAAGTEPADWMNAVLRGRNQTLEQSLSVVAEALKREFPPHLQRLPREIAAAHVIIVPAIVGDEPRLYEIDLVLSPDRTKRWFRYTRYVLSRAGKQRTPRIALTGSGASYFLRAQKVWRQWQRRLLRVLAAYERGRVSSDVVARELAQFNDIACRNTADGTVGSRCIVAWQVRRGTRLRAGGGHQLYAAGQRESQTPAVPTIAVGIDVVALTRAVAPIVSNHHANVLRGVDSGSSLTLEQQLDQAAKELPDEPDEKLR
jgi:hypothetical protein